jgi:hypothetical protein
MAVTSIERSPEILCSGLLLEVMDTVSIMVWKLLAEGLIQRWAKIIDQTIFVRLAENSTGIQ